MALQPETEPTICSLSTSSSKFRMSELLVALHSSRTLLRTKPHHHHSRTLPQHLLGRARNPAVGDAVWLDTNTVALSETPGGRIKEPRSGRGPLSPSCHPWPTPLRLLSARLSRA